MSSDRVAGDVPSESKDTVQRLCPICGKPAVAAMAPFCSKRCADVDLYRWLGGVYVVPDDQPGGADTPPDGDES